MLVYRISKKTHIGDLSGIGAGLYGGRWNPKGIDMVYTSTSIALASLEYLVHNYHILSTAEVCLAKIEICMPTPLEEVSADELPEGWNSQLNQQYATQNIGKAFYLSTKSYLLKVPSAVVQGEYNLLLNPNHHHHAQTTVVEVIAPFVFDQRILDLG
jgi:RES domain-containing protein